MLVEKAAPAPEPARATPTTAEVAACLAASVPPFIQLLMYDHARGRLDDRGRPVRRAAYPDPKANPRTCTEPNLLSRRELIEWPDAEETRSLAFGFGAWIEDSWGMQCRRFLANTGPLAGEFDRERYR